MRRGIKWREVGLVGLVAVSVGLLAWFLTGDDAGLRTEAIGFIPLVTPIPTPVPLGGYIALMPGEASSASLLVMIQGVVERRLVIWPLVGGSVLEVDRGVNWWPLLADPPAQQIFYATPGAALVFDVRARRAVVVGSLPPDSSIDVAQWSPDARAVAYVVEEADEHTAYVAPADGSWDALPMLTLPKGLPLDVAWLPDNQPVVIAMGLGPTGGLEAQYQLFDRTTHELLPLPPDLQFIQPWTPWRSPDGQHQLYRAPGWEEGYSRTCGTGPLALTGPEWVYLAASGSYKFQQIAFHVDGVYLDKPTWLADGRVVMRGVTGQLCLSNGSGLYVGELGEPEPRQIVSSALLFSAVSVDDPHWGVPYAISPDQTAVAWVENDLQARRSAVYLTPLDGSGPSRRLFATQLPADAAPHRFQDRLMIMNLVWLP